ncbi:trypsin-like peptidase domain-containing protein [Kitasatospora sp. NPDC048540]|uniref:S1C family serine protease n=1 Tax=unclassified Kitasatospora TaxID=2633591 RepID=UPI00053B8A14|nr:trypsin-like peptidase domain-containing protein [Kitasatospora sp. MBT63]
MSTEHEGGSTGPQEGQSSGVPEAGAPTTDHTSAAAPQPVVESAPTLALSKQADPQEPAAPAAPGYLDAPPPVIPAAPAAPASGYLDAPPPAVPHNPYAPPLPGAAEHRPAEQQPVTPEQAAFGQGAPGQGNPPAGEPGHHPFGAGHPLGGWGTPPGGTGGPGVPGYPSEWGGGSTPPGPRRKRGSLIALVAAAALVAGLAGGAIGASLTDGGGNGSSGSSSHTSTTVTVGDNKKALDRAPDSVAGIAAAALPSTVTIKAQGSSESGTGTGFVFDTEGHILTNNHVVAPAASGGKLTVKFSDGSSYPASVVGRAQGYDVAVVKLDNPPKDKLVPLPIGDSDKTAIGDATIAIGAPYGLEGTVTTGIISAKDRPVASGDDMGSQSSYMNALQTDASINPGNSGGPLLNASGQVIGINSAIQSNTGGSTGRAGSIGLGFAIPINQAKWVAETLIKDGTPVYAILGVLRNDDYKGDGAQIPSADVRGTPAVTPGGPADQAGLKPGDVITKLGGIAIDSGPTLVSEIWTHKPGEKVEVEYTRDGKTAKTTITLGERKGDN